MHLLSLVPALAPPHRRRASTGTALSSLVSTPSPSPSASSDPATPATTSSPSPSSSLTPSPASLSPSASASPGTAPASSDTPTPSPSSTSALPPSHSSLSTVLTSAASSAGALAQPASSTPTPLTTAAAAADASSASQTVVLYTLTPATPSSTATSHSSSSGFLSNTAAVAGTFTVVGLIAIAAVLAIFLLVLKRRQDTYEDDTEYLDKATVVSTDPARTHATSLDHGSPSDSGHYGTPMALPAPPVAAYYPEHAYALHPQVFQAENPSGFRGYSAPYPQYPQGYAPQRAYSSDDHSRVYPHVASSMPNPHELSAGQVDSTPAPQSQSSLPNALRPSVSYRTTPPTERAGTRFSVDSFYTGIARDISPPPGQAI